jgi:hypothetical protein
MRHPFLFDVYGIISVHYECIVLLLFPVYFTILHRDGLRQRVFKDANKCILKYLAKTQVIKTWLLLAKQWLT